MSVRPVVDKSDKPKFWFYFSVKFHQSFSAKRSHEWNVLMSKYFMSLPVSSYYFFNYYSLFFSRISFTLWILFTAGFGSAGGDLCWDNPGLQITWRGIGEMLKQSWEASGERLGWDFWDKAKRFLGQSQGDFWGKAKGTQDGFGRNCPQWTLRGLRALKSAKKPQMWVTTWGSVGSPSEQQPPVNWGSFYFPSSFYDLFLVYLFLVFLYLFLFILFILVLIFFYLFLFFLFISILFLLFFLFFFLFISIFSYFLLLLLLFILFGK